MSDMDFGCGDPDCELCYNFEERKTMSTNDYMTSRGYGYETEAKAIAEAKKFTVKNYEDVKIYKAYKIVTATIPNVDVADYTPVATA